MAHAPCYDVPRLDPLWVPGSVGGGIGELVGGDNGFLLPADDEPGFVEALRRFVFEPSVRESLWEGAARRADRLAASPPSRQLLSHWSTLAGARPPRRSELDAD